MKGTPVKTLSWPRSPTKPDSNGKAGARAKVRHRILVADHDTPFARRMAESLFESGFEARVAANVQQAKELIEFWQPDTVFMDLLLPDTNALSILKFLSTHSLKKIPKVVVMSVKAMPQGMEQMRRAGADHYLRKPFSLEEAFRTIHLLHEPKVENESQGMGLGPATIKELHLINLFLKQASHREPSLYNLMRMINLKTKAIRCSLIHVRSDAKGRVLASNDDEQLTAFDLDLTKYPEVLEVKRTLEPVIIPNARTSDILKTVQSEIARTPFETLILFPVFRHGVFFGALSLRMQQRDPIEIFYVEKFGQVCSQILSMVIGQAGNSIVGD